MPWPTVPSLVSDSEAYHEQMGLLPSSNGSLDRALSNAHTLALGDALFRLPTHQNWPRDRKLTELLVFALISRLTR